MPASLESIIQGTVTTVDAATGTDRVDSRQGGRSTWARSPARGLAYWIVDHEWTDLKLPGVGSPSPGSQAYRRVRRIVVHGWMPWSPGNGSAEAFRAKLSTVLDYLTTHKRLGVCARMVSLPVLKSNKVEPYSSNNLADQPMECHHGIVQFEVEEYYTVSGS